VGAKLLGQVRVGEGEGGGGGVGGVGDDCRGWRDREIQWCNLVPSRRQKIVLHLTQSYVLYILLKITLIVRLTLNGDVY
jgi:hypothetical protein